MKYKRLLPFLIAAITFITYLPDLHGDFVFDDVHIIKNNPLITGKLSISFALTSAYWAFTVYGAKDPHHGEAYRPLTTITNYILFQSGQGSPFIFRLVSLILHITVVLLLFILLKKLKIPELTAFVLALIYALHPAFVEVIASAANRSAIVVTIMELIIILLLFKENKTKPFNFMDFILVFILFFMGIFSKESALFFLILLPIIYWILSKHGFIKKNLLDFFINFILPMGLVLIIYLILRAKALSGVYNKGSFNFLDNPLVNQDVTVRILTGLSIIAHYIVKLFIPGNCCADYSYAQVLPVKTPFNPWVIAGILLPLIIVFFSKKNPLRILGAIWFLLLLFFISNIPYVFGTIMADRLLYTPSIGMVIWSGTLSYNKILDKKVKFLLATGIIITMGIVTFTRIPLFHDSCTLFKASIRCAPNSAKVWYGTGVCLQREHKYALSIEAFRKSLLIYPDFENAAIQYGQTLEQQGYIKEGINVLRVFVKGHPHSLKARFYLAMMLARHGQKNKARILLMGLLKTSYRKKALKALNKLNALQK